MLHCFNFLEALNASLLRFLLSVKHFIAVTFQGISLFNASSPLLFQRNSSLKASSLLLFKIALPTSAYRHAAPVSADCAASQDVGL
jgi:hypothetical protein